MQTIDKCSNNSVKLDMQGFVADEGDTITINSTPKNKNYYTRSLLTKDSSQVTFMGPLYSDIFRINAFLP